MTSAPFREAVFLVKEGGFSEEVAFGADDTVRTALAIVVSELNGAKFSWDRMEFEERK